LTIDDWKNTKRQSHSLPPGSYCHSRESGNPKGGTYYYRIEAGDYKCEKEMEIIR